MRIGYSFWGFLGPGIVDTPDGGRSHRRTLIDALTGHGHDTVFLQPDRDLTEAGTDLSHLYAWDAGLPDIDVLMLEWRWPIPGRNTTWCGSAGHTCDLHRQHQLVAHYTDQLRLPTIIWDKDRKLPPQDRLRGAGNVTICESALQPTPGAVSLLFPVDDARLDATDPHLLAQLDRHVTLAYVGNQYDRDAAFEVFFAPAAAHVSHVVAGKWTSTSRWPHVRFVGRVGFDTVEEIHRSALATILLLPPRYAAAGQMTQRLFEAVLAGCVPITPATIRFADQFAPKTLHVADGADVARVCGWLREIAGTGDHAYLLASCLRRLDLFRVSRQVAVLDQLLRDRVVATT
ncbi:hypothetical protein [Allorhizocola rhizosphaerae]|uniref:hypothetical protein n=1 Tax=Allorhizocola rhizosphaerae TaxID=1872709 RepID=UPI0014793877|nr:hypothetical protein [Allorhizocola rhizosphaerae]